MKKSISLLLTFIMLASAMTACSGIADSMPLLGSDGSASEESVLPFEPGKVENNTYYSSFVDLRLDVPKGWEVRDIEDAKKEIIQNLSSEHQEVYDEYKDSIETVNFDLFLVNPFNNSRIVINYEDLSSYGLQGKLTTLEQYCDASDKNTLDSPIISYTGTGKSTADLGGHEYVKYTYSGVKNDEDVYLSAYIRRIGNYFVTISVYTGNIDKNFELESYVQNSLGKSEGQSTSESSEFQYGKVVDGVYYSSFNNLKLVAPPEWMIMDSNICSYNNLPEIVASDTSDVCDVFACNDSDKSCILIYYTSLDSMGISPSALDLSEYVKLFNNGIIGKTGPSGAAESDDAIEIVSLGGNSFQKLSYTPEDTATNDYCSYYFRVVGDYLMKIMICSVENTSRIIEMEQFFSKMTAEPEQEQVDDMKTDFVFENGTVNGNTYENTTVDFKFKAPTGWRVLNRSEIMDLKTSEESGEGFQFDMYAIDLKTETFLQLGYQDMGPVEKDTQYSSEEFAELIIAALADVEGTTCRRISRGKKELGGHQYVYNTYIVTDESGNEKTTSCYYRRIGNTMIQLTICSPLADYDFTELEGCISALTM